MQTYIEVWGLRVCEQVGQVSGFWSSEGQLVIDVVDPGLLNHDGFLDVKSGSQCDQRVELGFQPNFGSDGLSFNALSLISYVVGQLSLDQYIFKLDIISNSSESQKLFLSINSEESIVVSFSVKSQDVQFVRLLWSLFYLSTKVDGIVILSVCREV